jgi:hypothetical protein
MPTQDELLLKIIEEGSSTTAHGLGDVADSLDKVEQKQESVADSAQKSAKGFKGLTVGAADLKAGLDIVANIGGKVIDFMKEAINDTIAYAAEVRDLSRSIGASAEETSSFIQVADDVGVSVGTIEAAFKAAIKNGIRPNIETLAKLSDEYRAIEDPVLRSQFAMEKFGRAGLDMAKILEQGGDAIKDAAKEAKALGLTLDENAVKAAREFEIQMDNMGDKLEALKISLAKGAIPKLNEFFDTLSRGTEVAGYLTQGIGAQDDIENKLTQSIALLTISQGENSAGVELASNALREYLQLKQQVSMTEQETALRANMAASATAQAARALEENTVITGESNAATKAYSNELLYNVQQYQAQQAAAAESAKAQEVYRGQIAEAGKASATAAEQFKGATDAQIKQMLAQSQIDVLSQALKEGTISQAGYNKEVDQVLLRYDLATPKSIAVAEAQQQVNEAFLSGRLPLNDYVTSAEKIPQIAQDGKISLEELASIGIRPVTAATDDQRGAVEKLGTAWGKIPSQVKTVYTIQVNGEPPSGGTSTPSIPKVPGYASGGNFVVPPGYPNDTYPINVSSGERVIVQPQNSVTNNYTVNADQAGMAMLLERQRMMNSLGFEARM